MLKIGDSIRTPLPLPAEQANVKRGANASLYQSVCCPARRGDFFLWAGIKVIGRFFANLFAYLVYILRGYPKKEGDFSFLNEAVVRNLLGLSEASQVERLDSKTFVITNESFPDKRIKVTFSTNRKGELVKRIATVDERNKTLRAKKETEKGGVVYRDDGKSHVINLRTISFFFENSPETVDIGRSHGGEPYWAGMGKCSKAGLAFLRGMFPHIYSWVTEDADTIQILIEAGFKQWEQTSRYVLENS